MPNIKSAQKRVSVTAHKKLQNQMVRSQMNTAIKKFNEAISKNDIDLAKTLLPLASSKIDNAAVKNVIHKNAANRKKAQIARTLSQLQKGIIVVKADAKSLKQAEQRAAAVKKAQETEAIKLQRNEAKKAKEAAKAPQPSKGKKAPAKVEKPSKIEKPAKAEKPAKVEKPAKAKPAKTEVVDGDEIK